ncbi:MAG: hypothetical protein ABJA80_05405 [bacterium]
MIVLIVALASAGATWILGWWGVAVVAVLAGVVQRANGGTPWRVALGCAAGWAMLLALDAVGGRFGRLTSVVAGVVAIPAVALLIAALLFPALIGWSGATVGALLSQRRAAPDRSVVERA